MKLSFSWTSIHNIFFRADGQRAPDSFMYIKEKNFCEELDETDLQSLSNDARK